MMPPKRAIRIGGCSGSALDRRHGLTSFTRNYQADPVDVISGDWMSEANTITRAAAKHAGKRAYEATFLESLEPALPDIAKHGIKVITNAGASDTELLHSEVVKLVEQKGLKLNVAWVSGDDVLSKLSGLGDLTNNHTKRLISDGPTPIGAKAYLGGLGIAAALEAGADIVLCGRVSDASPVIGAAAWWHGWSRSDLDSLANALIAGHLIECSTYVTGGNFSGFKSLNGQFQDLGFPIAEIDNSGKVLITKQSGSQGLVTVETCTAQLLYEIQGPWYFNSDVTADISAVSFSQVSQDRVSLSGVKGSLPPSTTKAFLTLPTQYQAESTFYLTGLDIHEKAALLESQIRHILKPHSQSFSALEFQLIGAPNPSAKTQNGATVIFRIVAQAPSAADLDPKRFGRLLWDTIMQSYPGGTINQIPSNLFPRAYNPYAITLFPQSAIEQTVRVPFSSSSQTISISPPSSNSCRTYPAQPNLPTTNLDTLSRRIKARGGTTDAAAGWAELSFPGKATLRSVFGESGRTVRVPLGAFAHVRSGDKGPDVNVGIFLPQNKTADDKRRRQEWDALRLLLSSNRLKDLLGDDWKTKEKENGVDIVRCEFPGIRAVHFVLKNWLGKGGANDGVGIDIWGKNVGEFIRGREVEWALDFLGKEEKGRL